MAEQSDTTTQRVPEMVERVARYLFDAGAGLFLLDTPIEPKWENASPMRQLFFRTVAAGVIGKAMREPPHVDDPYKLGINPKPQQIWANYINIALGGDRPPEDVAPYVALFNVRKD
jgi:hypothetical protein